MRKAVIEIESGDVIKVIRAASDKLEALPANELAALDPVDSGNWP